VVQDLGFALSHRDPRRTYLQADYNRSWQSCRAQAAEEESERGALEDVESALGLGEADQEAMRLLLLHAERTP
jgi:hypothetical protein